jgi:hypothetical protein
VAAIEGRHAHQQRVLHRVEVRGQAVHAPLTQLIKVRQNVLSSTMTYHSSNIRDLTTYKMWGPEKPLLIKIYHIYYRMPFEKQILTCMV